MAVRDGRSRRPIRKLAVWAAGLVSLFGVLGLIGYLAWYDTGYGQGADTEQAAVSEYLRAMNDGDTPALDELIDSPKYDGPDAQLLIDACGRRDVTVDRIDYTDQVRPYLFNVHLVGRDRGGRHDEWIGVERVWKRWYVVVRDTEPGPGGHCVRPSTSDDNAPAAFPATAPPHRPTS